MFYFNTFIIFLKILFFYSRKGIDFSIWALGLYIFMYGYHNLQEGKEILLKLSNNMNSKRYFSDMSDFIDASKIENLFALHIIYTQIKVILF